MRNGCSESASSAYWTVGEVGDEGDVVAEAAAAADQRVTEYSARTLVCETPNLPMRDSMHFTATKMEDARMGFLSCSSLVRTTEK